MRYAPLVWKNLWRNKLRTAMTGGAIMLAVVLVCLLLTMPAGMDAMLNQFANNTRLTVHNKAGIVYSMPYSFTRKVRQTDDVVDHVHRRDEQAPRALRARGGSRSDPS